MALVYSVRLSRCTVSAPGLRSAAAARSSPVSIQWTNAPYVASSGRGRRGGGISRARSLRITFSQTSAPSPMCTRSSDSSVNPAVCKRSLWQAVQ